MVMTTPIIKKLKEEGYTVVLNAQGYARQVVTCNPNVDHVIAQKRNEIAPENLPEYWENMSYGFDKVVNLSGTVEDALLKVEGGEKFKWSHKRRHKKCNKNYIDYSMKHSGYDVEGAMPELYFSKAEHRWAKKTMDKFKGKFVILWSLSGSAYHKTYPFSDYTGNEFLNKHPDAVIITVGDYMCKILEWEHPRLKTWAGRTTIRQSMILTKYVDLVIGTETGILNASSCFDTPKIIMLSHSSEENLTKYWENVYPVHGDVSCYPCHQLHYTNESCKQNSATKSPLCMTQIHPNMILKPMEEVYQRRTA